VKQAAVAAMTLRMVTILGPTAAQAAPPPVVINKIYYNSPGADRGSNASLNAEWVQLHNTMGHRVTLTHWRLRDRAGHIYRFGTYRLKAHGYVKIHTGTGSNTQTNRYWGHSGYIWNNDGDTATLKDANGNVRSRCSYSDPSETHASRVC
jgi:hypothetical protein